MHDNTLFLDCEKCNGTGKEAYEPEGEKTGEVAYRKCTACNGTGIIEMDWDEFERMNE